MPEFLLPDLGEGLAEAEIVAWHVGVGDSVRVDEIVVELETAKAAVEVPVPFAGVVSRLHGEPGQRIAVGQPLLTVTADEPTDGFVEPGLVLPAAVGGADEDSGSVLIGYGTGAAAPRRTRAHGTRRRRRTGRDVAALPDRDAASSGPVPVISPLVRKMARDAGLDLRRLRGSGPSGIVCRRDVETAISQGDATGPVPEPPGGGTRIPLQGVRRMAAEVLSRSRREIPEATVWVDVDATEMLAARRALNTDPAGQPIGLLAILARFALLGLRRYPELNSRVEPDAIVIPEHVNLGFAAQTDRGLVVPVVHGADRLRLRELSSVLAAKTAAARNGTLPPAELGGGTFTVNNYGVFGVDGSAAIINHPEVAILGMGRIIDRPWVVAGEITVRSVSQLTLAFDHRVCDGGTAGGFLRFVADCIESPISALADL
jgi:pyruvate dehydrogenase E2 component (dihydrolipoamide acetyltransferase)